MINQNKTFENRKDNPRIGTAIDLGLKIEEIQIRVYDLFAQKLLSEAEAIILLKNSSQIKNEAAYQVFMKSYSGHAASIVDYASKECEEFIEVNGIKQYIDQMIREIDLDHWHVSFMKIIEQIRDFEGCEYNENVIRALLAQYLERAYNFNREKNKNAQEFGLALNELLDDHTSILPKFLVAANPSFQESVRETIDRLGKIEKIIECLKKEVEGIIVGGSMSYGLFYNIRGKRETASGSDIDILVIFDEAMLKHEYLNSLLDIDFFTKEEKEVFLKRKQMFVDLREKGVADIISQKFHINNGDYNLSMHFFPKGELHGMIGDDLEKDLLDGTDKVKTIKEYREKSSAREKYIQQNYTGEIYEYDIPLPTDAPLGVIVGSPAYIIKNQQLYPGKYQNLISPLFSVLYDKTGETRQSVDNFKRIMLQELGKEKLSGLAKNLASSHLRIKQFSPTMLEKINQQKL